MAKVATPKASPISGPYFTTQTVTLSTTTVGATLFYTTDGTSPTHTAGTPTGTTQIYLTPLSINMGTTLKVLGYLAADTDSNILTAHYYQGYSISGSLGIAGAGAAVIVIANITTGANQTANPFACYRVFADGSGNYTTGPIPNLVDSSTAWAGTVANFVVIPILFGAEFSPFSQSVMITNANVTGVNWSGLASFYSLIQDYSSSFGTSNPLTGWTTFIGDDALQAVSGNVEASDDTNVCGAHPTGYSPSVDSFIQWTIAASNKSDITATWLRTSVNAGNGSVGFDCEIALAVGTIDTFAWQLNEVVQVDQNPPINGCSGPGFIAGYLTAEPTLTVSVGDSLLYIVRGQNAYFFYLPNGSNVYTPLGAMTSSDSSAVGLSGIELNITSATLSRTSFSKVIGGAIIASSPSGGGTSASWLTVNNDNALRGSHSH